MHEERFKKIRIKEKGRKGSIHQLFYGAFVSYFMVIQDAGNSMLTKCLSTKQIPEFPEYSCPEYPYQ